MRNVAGYSGAGGVRDAAKPLAALAVAATVAGASLSMVAPAATAYDFTSGAKLTATTLKFSAAGSTSPRAQVETSITGLDDAQPILRLSVSITQRLPITSVTVSLPSGLAFSTDAAKLAHGVRTVGTSKPHPTVRKGRLMVSLKSSSSEAKLTVAGTALTESKALETSVQKLIQFNQAHPSDPRELPLKLAVTVGSGTRTVNVPIVVPFR